jgi:hypothetical protein
MIFTYLKKEIKRPNDLAPRGVRSTYQEQRTDFNTTFKTIWENLK